MSEVSTGHAKKLIKNYIDLKIGKEISPLDSRGVWFSREEIITALNNTVNPGTGDILPNGIRFYFAAYESMDPHGKNPPKHDMDASKITLVMVPTTSKTDEHGNIIMHPYRKSEILPFDLVTHPDAEPKYDEVFSLTSNDGQLCPPPKTLI
ncbi:MAG: hypothetical protein ABIU77_19155 [Ferruginibacter sp.]